MVVASGVGEEVGDGKHAVLPRVAVVGVEAMAVKVLVELVSEHTE